MSILKVKSKGITTSESKLVGVYMPLQVSSYLSLYALANEGTKSTVVRELIEKWYRSKKSSDLEEELIEKVTKQILALWRIRKLAQPWETFVDFQAEVIKELEKKGIIPEYIEQIILKLRDAEKKKGTSVE